MPEHPPGSLIFASPNSITSNRASRVRPTVGTSLKQFAMSIEVKCLQCGASHHVNDRLAGRRVRCPKCETAVHVPELEVDSGIQDLDVEEIEPIVVDVEPVAAAPVTTKTTPRKSVDDRPRARTSEIDDDEDDEVLPRTKRPEAELDMTPMVDVTFLLLIFFMVTAAFSLQKSIEMPRQQTDAPSTSVVEEESEDLDMVEVQVDEFGSFLVMAQEWERETPGKQNLITALKEALAGNTNAMRLVVKVHELAKLKSLVDAMDAGTIAGYAELEVTQVEEFD
jgi:biopolymer transport protein ExbD